MEKRRLHLQALAVTGGLAALCVLWLLLEAELALGLDRLGPLLLAFVVGAAWTLYALFTSAIVYFLRDRRLVIPVHALTLLLCLAFVGLGFFAPG